MFEFPIAVGRHRHLGVTIAPLVEAATLVQSTAKTLAVTLDTLQNIFCEVAQLKIGSSIPGLAARSDAVEPV